MHIPVIPSTCTCCTLHSREIGQHTLAFHPTNFNALVLISHSLQVMLKMVSYLVSYLKIIEVVFDRSTLSHSLGFHFCKTVNEMQLTSKATTVRVWTFQNLLTCCFFRIFLICGVISKDNTLGAIYHGS